MSKFRLYLLRQGFTPDQVMPMRHSDVIELLELDFMLTMLWRSR